MAAQHNPRSEKSVLSTQSAVGARTERCMAIKMGADLEKIKRESDCDDSEPEIVSDAEVEDGDGNDNDDDQEYRFHRSSSIYRKPIWQEKVGSAVTEDTDLFSDDAKRKLVRAHTVAACAFPHIARSRSPLFVEQEEQGLSSSLQEVNILLYA